MPEPELWTVAECAAHWEVEQSTWRKYVSQGHAPQPIAGYDAQRRRRWRADEVRGWPRPGQGYRTDLKEKH